MAWHRSWQADIGLRILGLAACVVAYLAFRHLPGAMRADPRHPGAAAYVLAAAGFLAASAGSASTLLGKHLFDRIAISARWRVRGRAEIGRR